jgi:secretion/DNA translocation related TadE-like protein
VKRYEWRSAPLHGDGGSGSIWLLGLGAALLVLLAAAASAGGVVLARHRAEAAADLGALAGAAHAVEGTQAACAVAGRIVVANGGSLVSCRLAAFDLIVTAEVRGPRGWGSARASARAGPIRST